MKKSAKKKKKNKTKGKPQPSDQKASSITPTSAPTTSPTTSPPIKDSKSSAPDIPSSSPRPTPLPSSSPSVVSSSPPPSSFISPLDKKSPFVGSSSPSAFQLLSNPATSPTFQPLTSSATLPYVPLPSFSSSREEEPLPTILTESEVYYMIEFETGNPAVDTKNGIIYLLNPPPNLSKNDKHRHARRLRAQSELIGILDDEKEEKEEIKEEKKDTKTVDELTPSSPSLAPSSSRSTASLYTTVHNPKAKRFSPSSPTSPSPLSFSIPPPSTTPPSPLSLALAAPKTEVKSTSRMVYIYGIPTYITIAELHDFTSLFTYSNQMAHIQIVTCKHPNSYIVLIYFGTQDAADEFITEFNGKQYNSLEEDVCFAAHLTHVRWKASPDLPPRPTSDPCAEPKSSHHRHVNKFAFPYTPTLSPLSSPVKERKSKVDVHEELKLEDKEEEQEDGDVPTCPVCLETINPSSKAMITILCNHQFHFDCLSKWADSTCPVCRYVMQPMETSTCFGCEETEDLWLCVLCGHIGCGRNRNKHALKHFEKTGHTFSLNIVSQRVWDYVSDNYVHRLILNKTDDKLVEWYRLRRQRRHSATRETSKDTMNQTEQYTSVKLEHMVVEYNYLLSSELDKQRAYYFQRLYNIEEESKKQIAELNREYQPILEENKYFHKREKDLMKAISDGHLAQQQFENQIQEAAARLQKLKNLNTQLGQQAQEERTVLDTQKSDVELKTSQLVKIKDQEINNLEEQIRELEFHLKTQKKLKKSGMNEDISGGRMFVMDNDPAPTQGGATSGAGGGRKTKKKQKNR